jgi:hypothetical protein
MHFFYLLQICEQFGIIKSHTCWSVFITFRQEHEMNLIHIWKDYIFLQALDKKKF